VALAGDFRSALRKLPEAWREARFLLRFRDPATAERAAGILGFLNPGRRGDTVRFSTSRRNGGHSPDVVASALRRLDQARIHGELELAGVDETSATKTAPAARRSLAAQWDEHVRALPPDWSDVFAEISFRSSDDLERAALLLSPLNPSRFGERPGFRYRVARRFGYGAAQELVRRCLERVDEAGIRAEVRILHALSDTKPVFTQGPVWYMGGKPV
jgi:hypothetical protein